MPLGSEGAGHALPSVSLAKGREGSRHHQGADGDKSSKEGQGVGASHEGDGETARSGGHTLQLLRVQVCHHDPNPVQVCSPKKPPLFFIPDKRRVRGLAQEALPQPTVSPLLEPAQGPLLWAAKAPLASARQVFWGPWSVAHPRSGRPFPKNVFVHPGPPEEVGHVHEKPTPHAKDHGPGHTELPKTHDDG